MVSFRWAFWSVSLLNIVIADPVAEAPLPRLHRRQAAACSSFLGIEQSCESATPSFTDLPLTSQVNCLCNPASVFDNAFTSCLAYLSTAETDLYSSFSYLPSSPCAFLGGSPATTTQASASTTSATRRSLFSTITPSQSGSSVSVKSNDPNYQACTSVSSLEDLCSSATPNWSDLAFTRQASCLCYQGSVFDPEVYDQERAACIAYFSTAEPSLYASLARNGQTSTSLCSSFGDSLAPTTSSRLANPTAPATPQGRPSTTSSGNLAPTSIAGGTSVVIAAGALALAIFL